MDQQLIEEAAEWRINIWGLVLAEAIETVGEDYFKGKRILEIGYGGGRYAAFLAKQGAEVVGIEISAVRMEQAKEYVKNAGVADHCRFIVGSIFELQEQFDLVVTKSVLYQIKDITTYKRWIERIYQLLKPNGEGLFIENGSGNALVRFYRRYFHRYHGYWNNVLSNSAVIDLFKERFQILDLYPHYQLSQFLPLNWFIRYDFRRKQAFNSCFLYWLRVRKQ